MNKRIWELAKQAYSDDMPYDSNIPDEFIVRLSELIVRECMAVANTYQNRGGNCYVDDMIAKHFGVEE